MTGPNDRSDTAATNSSRFGLFWALVAAAFIYRVSLILVFPTVYSWDAFTRLSDPTRLIVRHWMPVPQVPIYLTELAGGDMLALRLLYAAIGAAGAAFVGWYSLQSQGKRAGLATLALAATLPVYVIYTIVPYQEGSLILFLFIFLCVWKPDASEMSTTAQAIAAVSLALACLCRYEAWVFAALFALRPMIGRRFRELWMFAPAVLVIGWWLVVLSTIDTTLTETPPTLDLVEVMPSLLDLVLSTVWKSAEGLHYVGFILAIVGAVEAFRRGGLLGREVLLFWIVLFALTLYRVVYSEIATERMTLQPIIVATLYIPTGFTVLFDRLVIDSRARNPVLGLSVVALVLSFGISTRQSLIARTTRYSQEREVALHLEKLVSRPGPALRIGIVPRPISNTWKANSLRTIFGQSMKLRPDDPRWALGLERVREEQANLDRIVVFNSDLLGYEMLSPQRSKSPTPSPDPLVSVQRP